MKDKKREDIISYTVTVISLLALFIYSIIKKNFKGFIVVTIIAIFFLFAIIYLNCAISGFAKKTKKLNKEYHKLKEKNCRTLFEELFTLSYTDKLDELLKEYCKKEKVKSIQSLSTDVIDVTRIDLYYRYIGFDVSVSIRENEINYIIDSPVKYDGTSQNITFEKKKRVEIDINCLANVNEFLKMINELIKTINVEIKEFEEVNVTDEIFNGRLVHNFEMLVKRFKQEGLLLVILGPLVTIFFIIAFIYCLVDVSYREENIIGFHLATILCPAFAILFIIGIILGIQYLIISISYKKDFRLKRYKEIKQQLKNIKVVREARSRYDSIKVIRFLVLYYDNIKLIVPVKGYVEFNNRKNMRKFKAKCLEETCNIKYLERSKLVFDGANKYLNLTRRYFS